MTNREESKIKETELNFALSHLGKRLIIAGEQMQHPKRRSKVRFPSGGGLDVTHGNATKVNYNEGSAPPRLITPDRPCWQYSDPSKTIVLWITLQINSLCKNDNLGQKLGYSPLVKLSLRSVALSVDSVGETL